LVVDNIKGKHFKWFAEIARALQVKVIKADLTKAERLLVAKEEVTG